MLDVKRLRVLREVAACGSFSAAAEALAYTQSAVSQQIAALEREAGTLLVDRNARGVRLTEAGRALELVAAVEDREAGERADVLLDGLADDNAVAGKHGGLSLVLRQGQLSHRGSMSTNDIPRRLR